MSGAAKRRVFRPRLRNPRKRIKAKTQTGLQTIKIASLQEALAYWKKEDLTSPDSQEFLEYLEEEIEKTKNSSKRTATIDITLAPKAFLKLLMETRLSKKNLEAMTPLIISRGEPIEKMVSSPREFFNFFISVFGEGKGPNIEYNLAGRWYPISIVSFLRKLESDCEICVLRYCIVIGDIREEDHILVRESNFVDSDNMSEPKDFLALLKELRLRPLQEDSLKALYQKNRIASEIMEKEVGKQYLTYGEGVGIVSFGLWSKIDVVSAGTEKHPVKIIIEPELDTHDRPDSWDTTDSDRLPFVRAFNLVSKKYLYFDIDDIEEYAYDDTAVERLVLPDKIQSILTTMFNTPVSSLFGDVVTGKHGGLVILAHGSTGVGKTLTAEIFSEATKRPLYVMEIGELGVTLDNVENNLNMVFQRAARWNAILLFDEADVFMTQRDGSNLEKDAIVGIFLRNLDYYPGLMFLTTNRADVIDEAFASRITIKLNYPPLNSSSRQKIWEIMLKAGEFEVEGDLAEVAEFEGNGRQIRNLVRVLSLLHPDRKVTTKQILEACNFSTYEGDQ